jgi:hypothetical protein
METASEIPETELAKWLKERREEPRNARWYVVAPRVYVGNRVTALNRDVLQANEVSAIVNVASARVWFADQFIYMQLGGPDKLVEAADVVHAALQQCDGNVFVHCSDGKTCAPAVAASYLMRHHAVRVQDAVHAVQRFAGVAILDDYLHALVQQERQADVSAQSRPHPETDALQDE